MSRLRSAVLLGGTVVLMSYISAPAAPTPAPARATETEMRAIDAMAPLAHAATQEVEDAQETAARVRARLAVVPQKPVPQRDPFSFGKTPRVPKRVIAAPDAEPAAPDVAPPPPLVWPKLVALLTDNGKITAVLGVGDAVEMLQTGETAGGFLVRAITSTSIEVVHVATSVATRLTLR
jgi:hypothetical protein